MCLAIPAKIEKLDGSEAEVTLGGNRMTISTLLSPTAKLGDWVLVHAGFAITILDETEARETWDLLKQMDLPAPAELTTPNPKDTS